MKTKKQNSTYKEINSIIYNFLQDYEEELDPETIVLIFSDFIFYNGYMKLKYPNDIRNTSSFIETCSTKNINYYNSYLIPVFTQICNTPIHLREEVYSSKLFEGIPFISENIFNIIEYDSVYIDNEYLIKLCKILENNLEDFDLGYLFENLMTLVKEDDEDTSKRKVTGSFYTPKEIISYMVEESLINSILANISNIDIEKLNKLIKDNINTFNDEESDQIIQFLSNIKILEPSNGTGSFSLHMLNILYKMILSLEGDKQTYKDLMYSRYNGYDHIVKLLNNKRNYKLFILQNSLFSAEILYSSNYINTLRHYLYLSDCDIFPNLNFNFITANTLIDFNIPSESLNSILKDPEAIHIRKNIAYLNILYFFKCENSLNFNEYYSIALQDLMKVYSKYLKSYELNQIFSWKPFNMTESCAYFNKDFMFYLR